MIFSVFAHDMPVRLPTPVQAPNPLPVAGGLTAGGASGLQSLHGWASLLYLSSERK